MKTDDINRDNTEIILSEKPKAGIEIKEALDKPTVPAIGHLLKLKPKDRKWEPPYFDIEWSIVKKKDEDILNNIIAKLSSASKIYIATDYDAEGQLIAYNILKRADISVDSVHRMKFSSLEHEIIRKAFDNPIAFDKQLALSAEVRHYLDWYFGMNISKALTRVMKAKEKGLRKYYLTPVGRVQTPVLHRLTEKEKEINQFIEKEQWIVRLRGIYDENRLFNIKSFRFDKKGVAELWAGNLNKGTICGIGTKSYEITTYPPNKDYVVKECLGKGISAEVVDYMMQDLYLDGCISYPRTTSRQYKSHGIDTEKYLKRISPVIPKAKDAIGSELREGDEGGPHPAIYPIRPYYEKDLKGIIWNIIAEAFYKSHLPPEIHKITTTKVSLIGYKIVKSEDNPNLEIDDDFDIVYKIEKGKTYPPLRYDQLKMYDWMVENSIGTVDTRTQILVKLMRTYSYQTDEGLYTSSKGIRVVDELAKNYPDIIETSLTRKFEQYIEDVKNGKSVQNILKEGRKIVTEVVDKINSKEIDGNVEAKNEK